MVEVLFYYPKTKSGAINMLKLTIVTDILIPLEAVSNF